MGYWCENCNRTKDAHFTTPHVCPEFQAISEDMGCSACLKCNRLIVSGVTVEEAKRASAVHFGRLHPDLIGASA